VRIRMLEAVGAALGCNRYDTIGQVADAAKRIMAERDELLAALKRLDDHFDITEATTHMDVAEIVLHAFRSSHDAHEQTRNECVRLEAERDALRRRVARLLGFRAEVEKIADDIDSLNGAVLWHVVVRDLRAMLAASAQEPAQTPGGDA
jgi:hypothetical protein